MKAIFNDMVVAQLSLTLDDRGLQYGDGLFETIIVKNGSIQLVENHVDRLKRGMRALQMEVPSYFTVAFFIEKITALTEINQLNTMVVNIVVWRKPGGLYTPAWNQVNYLIKCRPYEEKEKTIRKMGICRSVSNTFQVYAAYKSNSLKYVLAGLEKKEKALDDLIILDIKGNISETMDKNIFWQFGSDYFTPSLNTGCIAGVMREHLLASLIRQGKKVAQVESKPEVLKQADRIFACNASGIYEVGEVVYDGGRMTDVLP